MKTPILIAAALLAATPALAEMHSKPSPKPVSATIDALEAAVTAAGAAVIARVDHAGSAKSVDMEMTDAQLLIFGNPKLGTPPMQADPRAGLMVPLRVLAYKDVNGETQLYWEDTAGLFEGLDVPADAEYRAQIDGALEKLTDKAVAE